MAKNTHKVMKSQWKKWNSNEQAMFNRLWSSVSPNALSMMGAERLTLKERRVLRWNICFMVACDMKVWRGFWKEIA